MVKLTYDGNRYTFKCKYTENNIARAYGFRWDREVKVWFTPFRENALWLRKYADAQAKVELGALGTVNMLPEQVKAIHRCLQELSGSCDGAVEQDGVGFSKSDTGVGKGLARKRSLTVEQAATGLEIIRNHKSQLPDSLLSAAGVW